MLLEVTLQAAYLPGTGPLGFDVTNGVKLRFGY
jgi:hypothetical protein